MSEHPPSDFVAALRALGDGLEGLGLPWMIIGGVAVIASGVARYTADIDATLSAPEESLERVQAALRERGIEARIESAAAFARDHHVLLLRHESSGVPIDVSLALLPFETEALRASRAIEYAGVTVPVAAVDDLIVYKLVASRPKDIDDAARLLALHGPSLDVARIRRTVAEFAEALEDRERPAVLERLLREAGLAPGDGATGPAR